MTLSRTELVPSEETCRVRSKHRDLGRRFRMLDNRYAVVRRSIHALPKVIVQEGKGGTRNLCFNGDKSVYCDTKEQNDQI